MINSKSRQHGTITGKNITARKDVARNRCCRASKKNPIDEKGGRNVDAEPRREARNLKLKPTARRHRRRGRSPCKTGEPRPYFLNPFIPLFHSSKPIGKELIQFLRATMCSRFSVRDHEQPPCLYVYFCLA